MADNLEQKRRGNGSLDGSFEIAPDLFAGSASSLAEQEARIAARTELLHFACPCLAAVAEVTILVSEAFPRKSCRK